MMTDSTALTIGPLRVIVSTAEPAIHAELKAAYRAFVVDVEPVPYTVTVSVAYAAGSAPAEWHFTFEHGILRFAATHYNGAIDLRAQQSHLNFTAPHFFEPLDYFVRAALALLAFEAGGLLFHAAGLARLGNGYAFFGYSGSGKTTVARVSSDAVVLNDDLVVLLHGDGQWWMYATPFSNPTQMPPADPQSVPLVALYHLVQDRRVFVEPIDQAAALAEVIASSPVVSADLDRAVDLLARAEQIVTTIPVQRLHFLPDPSFWSVVQP